MARPACGQLLKRSKSPNGRSLATSIGSNHDGGVDQRLLLNISRLDFDGVAAAGTNERDEFVHHGRVRRVAVRTPKNENFVECQNASECSTTG